MSATLETYVNRKACIEKGLVRVFFRSFDSGAKGDFTPTVRAIDVQVPAHILIDSHKVAELLALKYILLQSNVLGGNRTGKGLVLNVSNGAIKKAQKRTTSNKDLVKYGSFLQVKYVEASIITSRDFSWASLFNGESVMVNLNDCADAPIETPQGDVHITRHAIERYMERIGSKSLDGSFRALSKSLRRDRWELKSTPRPLKEDKKNQTTESWRIIKGFDTNDMTVVIIRHLRTNVNRIVTVM